jgi:hypothetical protein
MANKEFQDILTNAFKNLPDIEDITNGGGFDLVKIMGSIKAIPEYLEKDLHKMPKKHQKMVKELLDDAKKKATPEYIYEQIAKKKADANNSN